MTWRIGIAESTLASGRTGVSIGNTSTGFRTWQGPECNLGSARCILDKGQTIATLGIEAWVYPFVVMPWVATRIGKMPDLQIRCVVSTDKIRDMRAR